MALSINWITRVITVPQADLTLVSGTLYELDTDAFRLELKEITASAEGIPFPDTHIRNPPYTVAGTSYSQSIEIINGYSVEFEDGAYSVRLVGSNNNIFDIENGILVQNQVQVIPNNSAGLITVTTGSGLSAAEQATLAQLQLQMSEVWKLLGLDITDPVTITPSRINSDSEDIDVTLTGDGVNQTRMDRQ